jgi:hypothetical protein
MYLATLDGVVGACVCEAKPKPDPGVDNENRGNDCGIFDGGT